MRIAKLVSTSKGEGFRMRDSGFPEQVNLANLARMAELHIVIGKHMDAIVPGHFIERLFASLGQNHRIRRPDGRKLICSGIPPRTYPILIPHKTGMKGQNHQ
jgi:hypothetical protein